MREFEEDTEEYDHVFPQIYFYLSNGMCKTIQEYYKSMNKEVIVSLADILGICYYVEFKKSKKIDLLLADDDGKFVTVNKISKKLKKTELFTVELTDDLSEDLL